VLRVIARMNVGGPAYHVSLLSGRLNPERFETLLVAGTVGRGEASFEDLAERSGARLLRLPVLGPEIDPGRDPRALAALVRTIRRFRPHIVHTHTAKAGALGRAAAVIAGRRRPVIVHTYHGHVLRGYFGPRVTAAYRAAERGLAHVSDRLVGVSQAVVDDLVELGIAPRERFTVVPLGLDLDRFLAVPAASGGAVRTELGIADDDVLAVFAGRLVPIKRLDVLLDGVAAARASGARLRVAVVGDGELRARLEGRAAALGIDHAVTFLGFRRDLDTVLHAADVAVLSSDNEGTPVALIEAAAAGRPAIATDVGGVADVVTTETGLLVAPGRPDSFAAALTQLAARPDERRRMGSAAREHVRDRYAAGRLLADVEALYDELLLGRHG
jgi:glycosyltransferase involved in cell wall biosynthesis